MQAMVRCRKFVIFLAMTFVWPIVLFLNAAFAAQEKMMESIPGEVLGFAHIAKGAKANYRNKHIGETRLDSNVSKLSQKPTGMVEMAMAAKQPSSQRQTFFEKMASAFYAKDFHVHALLGSALSLGQPATYLSPGIGALADLQFEFLHKYFNPYFALAFTHTSGRRHVESMQTFMALSGVAYTFALPWHPAFVQSGSVSPFVAAGFSWGSITARRDRELQSFRYGVFTFSLGATLDFALTNKISVALAVRGSYLAESETPLLLVHAMLGVGYRL